MRLDHLLSKENILFLFCRLGGCWLAPGGDSFLLSRVLRVVARFFRWETAAHISCVWFGISETRMSVFVFGL